MKYMLLIYNEEKAWGTFSEAQRQGFMGEFMKFTQQPKISTKPSPSPHGFPP